MLHARGFIRVKQVRVPERKKRLITKAYEKYYIDKSYFGISAEIKHFLLSGVIYKTKR